MKLLGALSFISLAAAIPHHLDFQWHAWKHANKLHFPRSEEFRRYKNFAENRDFVNQHNKRAAQGLESYVVSLNKFAHMSHDEFYNMYLKPNEYNVADKQEKGIVLEYKCAQNSFSTDNNPDQVSYVLNGPNNLTPPSVLVSTVKDQGSCGSCWTFGAGAAIEAAACNAGQQDCSTWEGVAAQQLVDCASYNNELNPYDSHGCSGGFQSNALRYVSDFSGGINMWANYPYVSGTTKKEGTCVFDNTAPMVSISGCGMPAPNDEPQLVAALANVGPLTIAIDASGIGFQLYTGGVYTSNTCSSTRLNHAVTATGYGSLNGADYFEVKNSWGTGWGNGGYIDIARNAGNMCGVAADTQYAIIA